MVVGELPERRLDGGATLAQASFLGDIAAGRLWRLVEGLGPASVLPPDEIHRAAMNQCEDPRRGLGALEPIALRRAPDREERLLDRILGKRAVTEDPQRDAVGDAAEAVVEDAERVLVAARDRFEQLPVGQIAHASAPCERRERQGVLRHRRS